MRSKRIARAGRRAALLGCTALITIAAASEACAQAAPDEGAIIGEIVVTAQKREQNLQDVPIAVTAVTQETLKTNRIASVMDIGVAVPNLMVRKAIGGAQIPQFTMRGVVGAGSVPGQDRSISLYLDGVAIGSTSGSAFDLPDLERIEVLRGPQGTLFGRNSTAGAVSIITRNPSGKFGIRQELTYGNYDQFRSATRIETPAWGPLSASVSYVHDERTGEIKNLGAGQVWDRSGPRTRQGVQVSPKTLGDKSVDSWFVAVRFEPSDTFSTVYKFDWMENHFTPDGVGLVVFTPQNAPPAVRGALAATFAANPPPFAGIHRPKYVNNSWTTPTYQTASGHNITTNIRLAENLSLKNILAYRKSFNYANAQITALGGLRNVTPALGPIGVPYVVVDSQSFGEAKQWSDELQLNYDTKRLTLTTGALYFDADTKTGTPEGLRTPTFSVVPGGRIPLGPLNASYNNAKSAAAYVQAEVHATSQLDVVVGYRITRDKKTGTNFVGGLPFVLDYKKTKPTYLAGVNYRPTRDVMIYGKYSNGFVSGGAVGPIAFEPETVRSWEAGVKSDLLDRRLRVNAAAFTANYKHLQAVGSGTNIGRPELSTIVIDQGDQDTKGFEVEVTAVPVRGLTLNGSAGYTDFELKSVNPILGTLTTFLPSNRPKWTALLSGRYESEPVFDEARVVVRVDASWRSKVRNFTFAPVPPGYETLEYSAASWVVNSRISLQDIKLKRGRAEVALWVRNLTDNDLPMFSFNPGRPPYFGATAYYPARTFGIDVNFDY